jgi:SP family sugar:H+ symporter-like MFS transporter
MAKGREAEAMDFLVKYHGNGNPNDELVNFEFLELKESLEAEKRTKQDTWKEFVSTKGNRHRIAIVLLIVSCQNLSGTAIIQQYYTRILNLVGVSNTQQQTGINAGLTMFVWAVTILAAWVADRVKRRKLLLTTWSCLIVINVAFVVTAQQYEKTGSRAAGIANVVMLWLYDGCFCTCGFLL